MYEQKMLFYKFFSSFKIMGVIKEVNIKLNLKYLSFSAKYQKTRQ